MIYQIDKSDDKVKTMLIDPNDRVLLKLLSENSRASVTELAGALQLSRATVKSRIVALQSAGVIRKFTLELAEGFEQSEIKAVSLLEIDGQKHDRTQRTLARLPQVTQLYTTNGEWDLVAETTTTTLAEFDQVLTKISGVAGVKTVETCLLLTRLK